MWSWYFGWSLVWVIFWLVNGREFLIPFRNEPISHYLSVPFPTNHYPMVIFACTDLTTLIKRNKWMIPDNAAIEIFKTGVTVTNQFIPMINFFFQDATVGCTVKKVWCLSKHTADFHSIVLCILLFCMISLSGEFMILDRSLKQNFK